MARKSGSLKGKTRVPALFLSSDPLSFEAMFGSYLYDIIVDWVTNGRFTEEFVTQETEKIVKEKYPDYIKPGYKLTVSHRNTARGEGTMVRVGLAKIKILNTSKAKWVKRLKVVSS